MNGDPRPHYMSQLNVPQLHYTSQIHKRLPGTICPTLQEQICEHRSVCLGHADCQRFIVKEPLGTTQTTTPKPCGENNNKKKKHQPRNKTREAFLHRFCGFVWGPSFHHTHEKQTSLANGLAIAQPVPVTSTATVKETQSERARARERGRKNSYPAYWKRPSN